MLLEGLYAKALAPFGIDARELGVLLLLAGHEPASQQQAAKRLGVDRTTMVAVLDTLQAKGLVSRHPDAEDRRRNVVELTDAGRETLRHATRASDDAERAAARRAQSAGRAAPSRRAAAHRGPPRPERRLTAAPNEDPANSTSPPGLVHLAVTCRQSAGPRLSIPDARRCPQCFAPPQPPTAPT